MRYLMVLIAASALAQAPLSYEARHDHWRGFCTGRLALDETGAAFESAKEPKHSWKVAYLDAQQVRVLDNGEFRLLTYRDRPWRLGADRQYRVRVANQDFAARVNPWLERRLERRFVAGLAETAATPLWELPAKHRLRLSGTEGVLIAAADRIIYRTEKPGHSRTWLFSDIDNISSSDPYQFTIVTYERARGHHGDRKGFNFQLKQPLTEKQYDDLWRRLERRTIR